MRIVIPAKLKRAFKPDWARLVLAFLFFLGVFSATYLPLGKLISLDDQMFHIRFAELLGQKGFGIFKDFHWLYFSNISAGQHFIYYNFLFYLFLIPFAHLPSLILGTKLASVFLAALSMAGLYFFLLKSKEKGAFFWTIAIAAITNFSMLSRFMNTRPYVLAPLLLLLIILAAYKRKYWAVFLLAAFYFYWHTATFYFPLIAVGTYFMFRALYESRNDWRLVWSAVSGTLAAFAGSLVFAPGIWPYMKIIINIYSETILGKKVELAEGGELYPVNFFEFARGNSFIFALLVPVIAFEIHLYLARKRGTIEENDELAVGDGKSEALRGALFFLSILFFAGMFLSRRNGDFFVLISGAYIAMAYNRIFRATKILSGPVRKGLTAGIAVSVIYLFSANFLFIQDMVSSTEPYQSMEGTGTWLKEHAERGEVVFNASWNWFTTLFYYDPDNYYIAGLEPRYLYDYDSALYWKWWHISNDGYVCNEEECDQENEAKEKAYGTEEGKADWRTEKGNAIAESIAKDFKSRFVVSSTDLGALNDIMDNNGHFKKVYSDDAYKRYFVYEVTE